MLLPPFSLLVINMKNIFNFENCTIKNVQIGNNMTMVNGKIKEIVYVKCSYCGGKKESDKKCEGCGAK